MFVGDGETALVQAAVNGNNDIVELLIEAGADVNVTRSDGDTALSGAVAIGDEQCVNLLIKAGADVNAGFSGGDSPLYMAVRSYNATCAQILLNAGATVNMKRDEDGSTSLMRAAETAQERLVTILLEAGADVNASNNRGNTALMVAASSRMFNTPTYSSILTLLKGDALVNKTNQLGRNALKLHLETHATPDDDIVALLIAAGEAYGRETRGKLQHLHWPDKNSVLSLKEISRKAIRKYLLKLDSNLNLIVRANKLGLPTLLVSYLLFGAT